jgi:hypothetical protein
VVDTNSNSPLWGLTFVEEDGTINGGNFNVFDGVVNSQQYNGEEQLRVINDTNEKILALQGERFQAQLTAAEVEFGLLFASDENYYNKTRALYDAEEERYRDLLKNKKIDQAQFDAFIKQSTEARISLDQQELNAKMANFQAVSQLFAAGAALVGEQTKAGKAFAIASATIDTYVAANQVISDKTVPTFLKIITAAGIIIKGLSNVKRISEVALPTPGGDAGGDTTQTTKPMGTINVNAQRRAQGPGRAHGKTHDPLHEPIQRDGKHCGQQQQHA